jgi:hypothetical protein
MSTFAFVAASVILVAGATAAAASSSRRGISSTGPADLSVRAGSPIAVVSAQQAERPGRTFSWVLAAGGGAVVVVSGIGLAVAAKTTSDYESQHPGASGVSTITRDRVACARRLNRVSWGGLAIGGAAATWGFMRLLRSPWVPAVSAAPIPGGAALGLAGMF